MANSIARKVIWPDTSENVLVRAVFLYVGQGACSIILVSNGADYDIWVVDINCDTKLGGVDVPRLVKELSTSGKIRGFVNTHPHDDHLNSIKALSAEVEIEEIMHSGHKPSKKFGSRYDELMKVVRKVKAAGGTETEMLGSKTAVGIADAEYHVLSPAKHVVEDVNDEPPEKRKSRIHEQCGVIKFGLNNDWVIITGDVDKAAFEEHIMYHKDRLPSFALGASHQGSRTFFMKEKGDAPYTDGLDAIDPKYIFVSAPTQDESPHDHPHDEAMKEYEDKVGKENVHLLGEERYCYVVDIYRENGGTSEPWHDDGELVEEYGLEEDGSGSEAKAAGPFKRPQHSTSDRVPRKYG